MTDYSLFSQPDAPDKQGPADIRTYSQHIWTYSAPQLGVRSKGQGEYKSGFRTRLSKPFQIMFGSYSFCTQVGREQFGQGDPIVGSYSDHIRAIFGSYFGWAVCPWGSDIARRVCMACACAWGSDIAWLRRTSYLRDLCYASENEGFHFLPNTHESTWSNCPTLIFLFASRNVTIMCIVVFLS